MSKIDQLIAEHVFELGKGEPIPAYSEEIGAAWAVVDQICDRGFRLQLEGGRIWRARFYKSMAHTLETNAFAATSGNAAEAICKAALTLKGISF